MASFFKNRKIPKDAEITTARSQMKKAQKNKALPIQTIIITSTPNTHAYVKLPNGNYYGTVWGFVDKSDIRDLIEWDVRPFGEFRKFMVDDIKLDLPVYEEKP